MPSTCLYGYFTGNSHAAPRHRKAQRHLPVPTPPVFPLSPRVAEPPAALESVEILETPGVPEAPEVQDLRRLIGSRLSLATEAEAAGQAGTAAHHLDRAVFLEDELEHEQRVAAAH